MFKDILEYGRAVSRHWGPLVTGVTALLVSVMVSTWWKNDPPWWVWISIITASILISCFLAWREEKKEKRIFQKQIDDLNTPRLALSLGGLSEKEGIYGPQNQTLVLKVTNHSPVTSEPKIYLRAVETLKPGGHTLHMNPGFPAQIKLEPGESTYVPMITFDNSRWDNFRILVPFENAVPDHTEGAEFQATIVAYGGSKPAELTFVFGLDSEQLLSAMEQSSSLRIVSDRRKLLSEIRQIHSPKKQDAQS